MLLQGPIADWLEQDWVRWFLLPGAAALALAVLAWLGDRRRMTRSNPDAVGLMPWRDVAFWAAFAAVLLLAGAAAGWIKS
ncbi:MAG: hypothetical protein RLZZ84_1952 [Pseudomonadota bacterium]|jgi:hypothetical protein